ncbi:MAG: ABC transporter permease, partial [Candidatus Baldrarchaeia archaeon]
DGGRRSIMIGGKILSLMSLSLEALRERKLRASLTILMVVIGCGLLVAVDALSTGTLTYIDEQFSLLGMNLIVVTPQSADFEITDKIVSEVKQIEGVKDAIPYIQQIVTIESRGESQSIPVIGIDQTKLNLILPKLSVKEGSIVQPTDNIGILLGNLVAYLPGGKVFAEVGQTVRLEYSIYYEGKQIVKKKSFCVRGILDYIGSGIIPIDKMAFISLSAANSFFERGGKYDGIYVITEDPAYNDKIMEVLKERYNVAVLSPKSIIDTIRDVSNAVSFFILEVAAISLLVASVGIITTLWTSVLERVREIGILKSIGFRERDILLLFLFEAIIIGSVGGGIGLVFGIGLTKVLTLFVSSNFLSGVQPIFTLKAFVGTWVLCVVLSAIAGFYPSWRASRLDPVVALRYE